MAEGLHITVPAYQDLEQYDSELDTCISLRQVLDLASLLHLSPRELVLGRVDETAEISIEQVVEAIRRVMGERDETSGEFSERVGWDIAVALDDPQAAWTQWNLDGLRDVCHAVGLAWQQVIPR
jgi:hypothetical protein